MSQQEQDDLEHESYQKYKTNTVPTAQTRVQDKLVNSRKVDFHATGQNQIKPVLQVNEKDENDDLLQWSMALDFDEYANSWTQLATSRTA